MIGLVVVLVLTLATSAAYFVVLRPRASSEPAIALPHGIRVVLPQGTDAKDYRLTVAPASARATTALKKSFFETLAGPWDIRPTPQVPAGTRLSVQLARGLKGPVFGVYFDEAQRRWAPNPTTYDPATGMATATVEHFTNEGFVTWAMDRVAAMFQSSLEDLFGQLAKSPPEQPTCGPRNAVQMFETHANGAVLSCHDATMKEQPTADKPGVFDIGVRLTNARQYPIDVIVPSDASVTVDDSGSAPQRIGTAIMALAGSSPGTKRVMLSGGATASIIIHDATAPFEDVKVATQLDPPAFATTVLVHGLEEFAAMVKGPYEDLRQHAKQFTEMISRSDTLAHALLDFRDDSDPLSVENVKQLTSICLDLLKIQFEGSPFVAAAGLFRLIVGLFEDWAQGVQGALDSAVGDIYHEFTFGLSGPEGYPQQDLRKVDWKNAAIPGGWFLGPNQVKLSDGQAKNVPTQIQYMGKDEAEIVMGGDRVVYGDLDGDGLVEAGVEVWVDAAGTAASQRAQGWIIFRAGPNGPVATKAIVPKVPPANAWAPNPREAHITFVNAIRILSGEVLAGEMYYKDGDADCCPSGRATTTWTYRNGTLEAGTPVIRR